MSLEAKEGDRLDILMQGFEEHGMMLTCADLGEPPPEGRERLYQILLEANDLYADTAGATLSLNKETGRVRLQRYDDMDVLAKLGPAKALIAFCDIAASWQRLIAGFRDAREQSFSTNSTKGALPSDAMMVEPFALSSVNN